VPAGEVEALVVQAIGKRIVEARIDQLRGVVAVAKCVPRTFGADQWRELQQQLGAWRVSRAAAAATAAGRPMPGLLALRLAHVCASPPASCTG
jgi:hypothetical protein